MTERSQDKNAEKNRELLAASKLQAASIAIIDAAEALNNIGSKEAALRVTDLLDAYIVVGALTASAIRRLTPREREQLQGMPDPQPCCEDATTRTPSEHPEPKTYWERRAALADELADLSSNAGHIP